MTPSQSPRRSLDGFGPRGHPQIQAPVQAHPPQQQAAQPTFQRRAFTAPQKYQPRKHWWRKLLPGLVVVGCMCASFFLQSLAISSGLIALYAAVAWWRHIPSNVSFVLAGVSLASVVVVLVVKQNTDLANNFATYTFLFLVIAVISAALESRPIRKKRAKL